MSFHHVLRASSHDCNHPQKPATTRARPQPRARPHSWHAHSPVKDPTPRTPTALRKIPLLARPQLQASLTLRSRPSKKTKERRLKSHLSVPKGNVVLSLDHFACYFEQRTGTAKTPQNEDKVKKQNPVHTLEHQSLVFSATILV